MAVLPLNLGKGKPQIQERSWIAKNLLCVFSKRPPSMVWGRFVLYLGADRVNQADYRRSTMLTNSDNKMFSCIQYHLLRIRQVSYRWPKF